MARKFEIKKIDTKRQKFFSAVLSFEQFLFFQGFYPVINNLNYYTMKKLTAILLLLFSVAILPAQTSPEQASDKQQTHFKNTMDVNDFTVVDSDGVEWNLYTLLDGGTTVILDLFQST